MLGSARLVAFVATTDVDRAMSFYRDVLGLSLVSRDAAALVFDANGTMLRVTTVKEVSPAPYTVLGWEVSDVEALVDQLRKADVEPIRYDAMEQDVRGIWKAPSGAQIVWFHDPDGNVLSLTQL